MGGNVAGLRTGGGSGYYGGSSGIMSVQTQSNGGSGSGGSSFISSMTGCVAIDPVSTTEPRAQDTGMGFAKTALNFSTDTFGTSPTWADGKEITFTNISMIDGAGYEWNTGTKAATPTGMPDWSKTDGSTMTGNTGDGYARITKWEKLE